MTPDGRYLGVRGRLWRRTNPNLPEDLRDRLIHALMEALGERGPVWWQDGAPDYNRHLAKNTPYADWFAALMH
ncbi:hypothetical protein [Novosphingobium rosa]|uniref:hypothetical protein n=1 Tax=Novosphingobium rosa TaxID=76978 RepID=UPI001C3F7072